jgi:hypothetical protein
MTVCMTRYLFLSSEMTFFYTRETKILKSAEKRQKTTF